MGVECLIVRREGFITHSKLTISLPHTIHGKYCLPEVDIYPPGWMSERVLKLPDGVCHDSDILLHGGKNPCHKVVFHPHGWYPCDWFCYSVVQRLTGYNSIQSCKIWFSRIFCKLLFNLPYHCTLCYIIVQVSDLWNIMIWNCTT